MSVTRVFTAFEKHSTQFNTLTKYVGCRIIRVRLPALFFPVLLTTSGHIPFPAEQESLIITGEFFLLIQAAILQSGFPSVKIEKKNRLNPQDPYTMRSIFFLLPEAKTKNTPSSSPLLILPF
jgi:hypothetical protein